MKFMVKGTLKHALNDEMPALLPAEQARVHDWMRSHFCCTITKRATYAPSEVGIIGKRQGCSLR
jgi:hypothetical protein